jgi:NAD/NADP transhydrogenase beta subunit
MKRGTVRNMSSLALCLPYGVTGVGAGVGTQLARKMKITELPQMVAGFHSLVGWAAAAASIANVMMVSIVLYTLMNPVRDVFAQQFA